MMTHEQAHIVQHQNDCKVWAHHQRQYDFVMTIYVLGNNAQVKKHFIFRPFIAKVAVTQMLSILFKYAQEATKQT